jgi:hypothetical protein
MSLKKRTSKVLNHVRMAMVGRAAAKTTAEAKAVKRKEQVVPRDL